MRPSSVCGLLLLAALAPGCNRAAPPAEPAPSEEQAKGAFLSRHPEAAIDSVWSILGDELVHAFVIHYRNAEYPDGQRKWVQFTKDSVGSWVPYIPEGKTTR